MACMGVEAGEVRAFLLLTGLHGELGGEEGGDVVLAGIVEGDVVAAAVGELEAEGLVGTGEDGGFVGGDDVGGGGLGEVGDEDVTPDGGAVGAGDDVLCVEDVVLEVFVEDARLNFDGGLAGLGGVFVVEKGLGGAGSEIERVGQAGDPEEEGEEADDADEGEDAQAGGAHGGDFAVGCQAAEAEQDADQDGHGNGEGEEAGQQVGDEAKDVEGAGDAAHRELHEREQIAHEENEGEEHAAEQSVAGDFAEDVASERCARLSRGRRCFECIAVIQGLGRGIRDSRRRRELTGLCRCAGRESTS